MFRGFMQSATESFILYDKELNFVEVNDSWLELTGQKREEVIGKHALGVFPELKESGRYDAYLKVIETGEAVAFREVELNSSGSIVDITAFKTGNNLGITITNVSNRVKYQRRLETLHGHANALSLADTLDEVANLTRDFLVQFFGLNIGDLSFVEGNELVNRYYWGAKPKLGILRSLDGPGIIVKAVNTGTTQNIGDVRDNPLFVDGKNGVIILSELAVPVMVSGKAIGVINLESEVLNAYSENDQRLVETLASHIANAYSRIQYNERLSVLRSFAFELGTVESEGEVIETTFRILTEVLKFQFSSFQLLKDQSLVMVGTGDASDMGTVFPLSGKGITTRAAREARTMLVGDVRDDPDFVMVTTDSRSELAVPIMIEDQVLGVLNVESLQLNAFNEDDASLLEVLSQFVGAALTRLQVMEDTKALEREILVQRVRVEQEQELSRLKNQFISTATHELRTPVTSIIGYLDLLFLDPNLHIPENIKRDIEIVHRNAMRLVNLTNDLLDVQRITTGKFEINKEERDLTKILNIVLEEITPLFNQRNQNLIFNAPDTLKIKVDEIRMIQLLTNILRNANKFTPENGQIKLTVEPEEKHVLITVKDTGVGLSEDDIIKLFKPFPGIRHNLGVSSTGLGLAICQGIVEMHEGEISACSDGPGKGASFTVKLPRD